MAQALFDEHPLGDYLRDNGETPLLIPGTCPVLEQELIDFNTDFDDHVIDGDHKEWTPQVLLDLIEFLQTTLSSTQADTPKPFVEKFKYNVISSSLLSPALPTTHSRRSSTPLSVPGKLHSRASSLDHGVPISPVPPSDPSYAMISLLTALTVTIFSTGYLLLALISLIVTLLLVYNLFSTTDSCQSDMIALFNSLDDLIQANQVWESVVQDAVTVLESDERTSLLHSPPSPPSPPISHVRVALHSCLQTTHTQFDNIRNIFSALTCPAELSQLSEMYAPQSPNKTSFSPEPITRPFSFPQLHSKSSPSVFTTPENKRATWSGSYASLASAGSPMHSPHRRRDKHRTGLSDVFGTSASSAPTIPGLISSRNDIPDTPNSSQDPSAEEETMANSGVTSSESNHFGVAALELQRKRRSGALEAFRSSPTASISYNQSPRSARNSMFMSSMFAASKFTILQPARHPLSLSALNYAVKSAIAAKRYTCSHLLAFRFSEEEDEGYWEDVRSVMGLLISTLADASSRLSEALDEAEQQDLQDQIPITSPVLASSEDETPFGDQQNFSCTKTDNRVSFAPMPNHISRFAAHIAAISSAMDDARDHLEKCISAIKEDSSSSSFPSSSQRSRHFSKAAESTPEEAEVEVPVALQAYERLRRELGLALRECERGRDRLLEIVNPPIPSDEEEFDDLPSLGHDLSDDSDKTDPPPLDYENDLAALVNAGKDSTVIVGSEGADAGRTLIDDATCHLLLTATTKHLPMPGIEEVFEADMGTRDVFSRERSKLTREERIKAAQARRASGLGLGITFGGGGGDHVEPQKIGGIEKWGPGGEVVQELKDVIWKVNEKRQKMADASQTA